MRGAGANRKRKPIGQALHQLCHTVEDGLLVAKYLNQSFLPESEEFLDGLRGMMFFDEGLPKDAVGSPVKIGKVDTVIVAVTHLLPEFQKRHFMNRLAVDDHAVHVENYRVEPTHFPYRYIWFNGQVLGFAVF